MTRAALSSLLLVILGACGGSDTGGTTTSLVTLEQVLDFEEDISGATGIDLEELEPTSTDICEAFDAAPSRWLQDALIPNQIWVGNFEEVEPPSDEVGSAIDELLDFGRRRLRWSFTGGDRPLWEGRHELAERRLTEWAVVNCDLSPVIGPWTPGIPRGWSALTADEIAERCDREEQRVREAQAEYKALTGAYARHVIALETHLEFFYASDDFYLTDAQPGSFALAPVPDGACDSD